MSGRSRQHAEAAAAVDARRRHQGGEAVAPLRRQDLRATAAGGQFRVVVDEVLAVEFA